MTQDAGVQEPSAAAQNGESSHLSAAVKQEAEEHKNAANTAFKGATCSCSLLRLAGMHVITSIQRFDLLQRKTTSQPLSCTERPFTAILSMLFIMQIVHLRTSAWKPMAVQ